MSVFRGGIVGSCLRSNISVVQLPEPRAYLTEQILFRWYFFVLKFLFLVVWRLPIPFYRLEEARDLIRGLHPSGGCNLLKAFKKILKVKKITSILIILGNWYELCQARANTAQVNNRLTRAVVFQPRPDVECFVWLHRAMPAWEKNSHPCRCVWHEQSSDARNFEETCWDLRREIPLLQLVWRQRSLQGASFWRNEACAFFFSFPGFCTICMVILSWKPTCW